MKKNNLITGALILSVGSVLAKVFSAIYRIALTYILGGEGTGLYQLIFPFYSLCVVLATAGIPMAISKVIAKNKGNDLAVIKKSIIFTSSISLVLTLILVLSSSGLAKIQGQNELTICYLILAPTIILVSLSSVLRGYFQGKHNFTPSAISNILEQFVKMCVGIVLSLSLVGVSLIAGIIGAIIGIVVSEVISIIILLLYIKKEKFNKKIKKNIQIKDLTKDILPITLTNIILPISSFIDSLIVVRLLSVNFSSGMSVYLYGLESGAASSLATIPTIFSFAIASVILPNITKSKIKHNRDFNFNLSIKIVLIITIPFVIGFILVPNRLLSVIYQNRLSAYGVNGIRIAATLLSISAIGIPFLATNQVFSSCLQAVDERYVAVRNLSISVIMKFVVQILFMPSKFLNIYALAIANSLCYVLAMTLNYVEIKRSFSLNIDLYFIAKLVFANSIMIFALVSIMSISNRIFNTILSVLVAGVVYFIILFLCKILTKKDKAFFKYKV